MAVSADMATTVSPRATAPASHAIKTAWTQRERPPPRIPSARSTAFIVSKFGAGGTTSSGSTGSGGTNIERNGSDFPASVVVRQPHPTNVRGATFASIFAMHVTPAATKFSLSTLIAPRALTSLASFLGTLRSHELVEHLLDIELAPVFACGNVCSDHSLEEHSSRPSSVLPCRDRET